MIDTILESITDKGLLGAFVLRSVDAGLVVKYEALGDETSSAVIRAQVSQILCETGNRAIDSLAKALAAMTMWACLKSSAVLQRLTCHRCCKSSGIGGATHATMPVWMMHAAQRSQERNGHV